VFQATIDALGVPPERILHVGDSVHYDVDGGAAVGLQTIHMDPFGVCPPADHPHLRSLDALLG
jgi:putative hydrolase of the HAD superfamily